MGKRLKPGDLVSLIISLIYLTTVTGERPGANRTQLDLSSICGVILFIRLL